MSTLVGVLMTALTATLGLLTIAILQDIMRKMGLTLVGKGSITTETGATKEIEYSTTEPITIMGIIDLSNMTENHEITIIEYTKPAESEEYKEYDRATYKGKQQSPIIYIEEIPTIKGIKITVTQHEGDPIEIKYELYRRK